MRLLLFAVVSVALAAQPPSIRPQRATVRSSNRPSTAVANRPSLAAAKGAATTPQLPSFYWAVLANWLYFLSLGLNAVNVSFMIRQVVNGGDASSATPASIALSGNVEAVDKLLTFLGVGFLAALSDVHGRRPLMAWSALGFGLTNLLQASAGGSKGLLYLADLIDGCSSCMTPVCQAYVADCSPPAKRAANLGAFQGLSIGAAFIIAFPVGGILGAKLGPRVPLLIAAGLQLLNAFIIAFVIPESNPSAQRAGRRLNLREANAFGALWHLFGRGGLLRATAAIYFLVSLARNALDVRTTAPAQSGLLPYTLDAPPRSRLCPPPRPSIEGAPPAHAFLRPRLPSPTPTIAHAFHRPRLPSPTPSIAHSSPTPSIAHSSPTLRPLFAHAFLRVRAQAQFVNYANIRFGWSQQQTGPIMVLVGLMLAVAPRLLVPRVGLLNAILYGVLLFAAGLAGAGLAPSATSFVSAILVVSFGCVCIPALQALLTNMIPPSERGALLGGLGSLTELSGAIGSTMYSAILAAFASETPPLPNLPGMHFFVGSALLLGAWVLASWAFAAYATETSRAVSSGED